MFLDCQKNEKFVLGHLARTSPVWLLALRGGNFHFRNCSQDNGVRRDALKEREREREREKGE
jgi:hypothetical protein